MHYCIPKDGNKIAHHCWERWTLLGGGGRGAPQGGEELARRQATVSLKSGSREEGNRVLWLVWVWRVRPPTTHHAADLEAQRVHGSQTWLSCLRGPGLAGRLHLQREPERRGPTRRGSGLPSGQRVGEGPPGQLSDLGAATQATRMGQEWGRLGTKAPRFSSLAAGWQSHACGDYKGKQMWRNQVKCRPTNACKSTTPGVPTSPVRLDSSRRAGAGGALAGPTVWPLLWSPGISEVEGGSSDSYTTDLFLFPSSDFLLKR